MRSVVEIGANVPAFLAKLWKLVDDPDTDHLISWSPGGQMFSIQNQADFARELLPLYYKHNNMASFIRQLNMYGFHKVTSVDNGGLKSEKDEIEFCHPCFLRGHPFLLEHIKRKIANPKPISSFGEEKPALRPEIMNKVLVDVKQMKGKQESLDARFSVMKHENEALWREIALLRQKHIKQQQIVNNLIQFLMSLVQPSRNGPLKSGAKRRYQLMINNAAHNSHDRGRDSKSPRLEPDPDYELDENDVDFEDAENGPTIHEVAEQEHLSDAAGRSARLCADVEACPSASPAVSYTSPSPAFSHASTGNDNIVMAEDMDDPALQNIPVEFDTTILTSEIPLDAECEPLLPEELFVNKRKHSKSVGKHSKKSCEEVITPTKAVPACTITSSQPTPTLPSNIFDSDETSSQDGAAVSLSDVNQQAAISALQNASDILFEDNSVTDDVDYLNTLASGSYNPNINLNVAATPPKGSKTSKDKIQEVNLIRNIKEEIMIPEEEDWSNMSLATVSTNEQSRPALNRFQSVSLKEFASLCPGRKSKKPPGQPFPNEEVDDHLDAMQTDLESLKELLRGDSYSFDANTLLGLFSQQEEPFYNLPPMNPAEITLDKSKEAAEDSASQLISYVPPSNLFDFGDIQLDSDSGPGDWPASSEKNTPPLLDDSSPLHTPQVQLSAPDFAKNNFK